MSPVRKDFFNFTKTNYQDKVRLWVSTVFLRLNQNSPSFWNITVVSIGEMSKKIKRIRLIFSLRVESRGKFRNLQVIFVTCFPLQGFITNASSLPRLTIEVTPCRKKNSTSHLSIDAWKIKIGVDTYICGFVKISSNIYRWLKFLMSWSVNSRILIPC